MQHERLPLNEAVVTGLGATTPLGGNVASTWAALLAGHSGIQELTHEWARPLPARLAALMAVDPAERLTRVEARRLDRSMQAAVVAAREAWADAGLGADARSGGAVDPERVAAVVATGIGGVTTLLHNHEAYLTGGHRKVSPRMVQMNMPNGPAAAVSIDLGARAAASTPVSACASGAEAVAHALDLIRLGRADVVIAGGTEACVHPLTMSGFAQARAMSTRNSEPQRASRPFDKGRDGFVLGEGAAVLIVERADHAASRDRTPYAVLGGAAITADAHDMVSPHPDGAAQARAMRLALADAGVGASDVAHVNAHATSTAVGDLIEARAIRSALGDSPLVCATKSMTGHLLGASGALEALTTVLSVYHGVVPPTPTLEDPDDDVTLDVTRAAARTVPVHAALSNSFGFGGHNAALLFRAD